ncbi:hypothetical protein PAEPH01_2004 [Pancytospora epiphaga]|nr:hypothetical protein PAEPH01_2004 [Pancytospora epiphaga]
MFLSKKTAWILHDMTNTQIDGNINSIYSQPRCVYIQDVIDMQAHRFFVSDGQHFINSVMSREAFTNCMGRYDLASMELKGMVIQMTEYKFAVRGGIGAELVIEACTYIGEGSLSGESTNINEHIVINQEVEPGCLYQIDFQNVAGNLTCPLFCYVKNKLDEKCDVGGDVSCNIKKAISHEEDEPFNLFKCNIQSKLAHLSPKNSKGRFKERNILKERDLNASQSSSKQSLISTDAEMCKLSISEIEKHINFDESKYSVIFNEGGMERSQDEPNILKSSVSTIRSCSEAPRSSIFVPDGSFISLGPGTLEAVSGKDNAEPSLDKIFSESFLALCDSPLVCGNRHSTLVSVNFPSTADILRSSTKEGVPNESILTASLESNESLWTFGRKRMTEIRLPRTHKTMSKMSINIGSRSTIGKNELKDNKFFILNDFYTDISKAEESIDVECESTGTPQLISKSLGDVVPESIFDEQVYFSKRKPIMIKLCKGPYEPAEKKEGRGRKACLSIRRTPVISYYATGGSTKIYFKRDRAGTLLYLRPPEKSNETEKCIFSNYVHINRKRKESMFSV